MGYQFKDPLPLARVVRGTLFVWLAMAVVYAANAFYAIRTIEDFQAGLADVGALDGVDSLGSVIGIAFLLVNVVTIVLVARWIYRVNMNAHTLSDEMTMSPGWNIGFFAIPFANLWKPFEGIRQTWRVSVQPSDPSSADVPGWLILWWTGWILSGFLGNISFRMSMAAKTLDELLTANWVDVIGLPLDLLTGGTLLMLVTRLSRIQHERYDFAAQEAVFE